MDETPDIEKIVIHYADGTVKEVHKGFIADIKVDEGNQQAVVDFIMANINGTEMRYIIASMAEFGYRTAMFTRPAPMLHLADAMRRGRANGRT